jgi:hypothetical protein
MKTITITPTQPPKPTASPQPVNSGNSFLSHPGKVAGLFVGKASDLSRHGWFLDLLRAPL